MRRRRLVTLTTDIGSAYAAQMKAVLANRIPPGGIVDLAHDLRPHAIGEAAFLVRAMARGFPPGTVHVVVVDPGVGGRRAPIVIATRDGSRLVGPDNGVLMPLASTLGGGSAFRIERAGDRARVGTTFDGRDVFAPAAAALASGAPPRRLGRPIRPHRFELAEPRRRAGGATGEILLRDRFGNLISNVPTTWIPAKSRALLVGLAGRPRRRLPFVTNYEALARGRLGALGSSFGLLELAVGEGDAARRLAADTGTRLSCRWVAERAPTGPSTRRRVNR
ncbi:MAG TPA: SAM-dependent chlorinase/fluorinase [Thermoplasmata archaeon]|nr:SAM-dependent chlorinase/fluorinase [Thermoplasmata archaeon]